MVLCLDGAFSTKKGIYGVDALPLHFEGSHKTILY